MSSAIVLAWKDKRSGEARVQIPSTSAAGPKHAAAIKKMIEAGTLEVPTGDYTAARKIAVTLGSAAKAAAPAAPKPAAHPSLFRRCRMCRTVALHTTAPHLGCDDCV